MQPGQLAGTMRATVALVRRSLPALRRRAPWWREIVLLGVLYGVYEFSRGLGGVDVRGAFANGREILHLEHVWHLAPEPMLNAALEHATWLAVAAAYFYSVMHYVVTPTVLIWMYRKHRAHYGRARTALAISTSLGLIGYFLLPTAPPRMLAHSGLRDTLADTARYGWWAGEGSVPRGFGALTNEFAAMPSLHVGWSIWCGVLIALYARRRWVKALGVGYPVATTLVVMATGNHYLLDAVAGGVTMGIGTLIALALRRRRADASEADADRGSGVVLAGADSPEDRREFPAHTITTGARGEARLCRSGR